MAKLIKSNGETIDIRPNDGTNRFTLEELQKHVGGYIELVKIRGTVLDNECPSLIVNEEGTLLRLPENENASLKAGIWLTGDVLQLTCQEWKASMEDV